jgi:hypothetical protein
VSGRIASPDPVALAMAGRAGYMIVALVVAHVVYFGWSTAEHWEGWLTGRLWDPTSTGVEADSVVAGFWALPGGFAMPLVALGLVIAGLARAPTDGPGTRRLAAVRLGSARRIDPAVQRLHHRRHPARNARRPRDVNTFKQPEETGQVSTSSNGVGPAPCVCFRDARRRARHHGTHGRPALGLGRGGHARLRAPRRPHVRHARGRASVVMSGSG